MQYFYKLIIIFYKKYPKKLITNLFLINIAIIKTWLTIKLEILIIKQKHS